MMYPVHIPNLSPRGPKVMEAQTGSDVPRSICIQSAQFVCQQHRTTVCQLSILYHHEAIGAYKSSLPHHLSA